MDMTKKAKPFVPHGNMPMNAEFGELLYGVHEPTGVPYRWPANVVDITCLLCERRTGRPLAVTNEAGDEITFPMCSHCRDEVMQFDELPDELNELMLERMIERRIVDAQVEKNKAAAKTVKAKAGPEKLDRDPA
jgi:hypothetical protein